MAFERKDYGVNSGIPFTRIADRVEVNVAPEGERISDPRWSGRSSNRRGFVLFARGWIEYGCGPDYRWGKPTLSRFPGGDARMRYLSQATLDFSARLHPDVHHLDAIPRR